MNRLRGVGPAILIAVVIFAIFIAWFTIKNIPEPVPTIEPVPTTITPSPSLTSTPIPITATPIPPAAETPTPPATETLEPERPTSTPPTPPVYPSPTPAIIIHNVVPGDHLCAISRIYYTDDATGWPTCLGWPRICEENGISQCEIIHPNQQLVIPEITGFTLNGPVR